MSSERALQMVRALTVHNRYQRRRRCWAPRKLDLYCRVCCPWARRIVDHPSLDRPSWLVNRGEFPEPCPDMVKHSPSPHGRILHTRTLRSATNAGRTYAARVSGAVPVAGGARLAIRDRGARGDLSAGARHRAVESPGIADGPARSGEGIGSSSTSSTRLRSTSTGST